ncbi:heavy metal translocating P-type ATPase [Helicobacter monodelphidis]|uniref:heavy metal translocating P-type ATPase n=1 Tax=Helicobacter sp. 15-1451 TaxID=2004995 RepID=UPI000DCEB860|nr:heavy metal translocating P-type ATPase [Helicobacter sp. 15-1451]RAX57347.1 heavy metal translocating P-type ATPase [Helicobacter sp. 15-1451]
MSEIASNSIGCECCSSHSSNSELAQSNQIQLYLTISMSVFYVFVLLVDYEFIPLKEQLQHWIIASYVLAYIVLGYGILKEAALGLWRRDFFNENSLMAIASLGAWGIGEGAEGVAILLFFRLGEALESRVIEKSRKSIRSLQSMKIDQVHILRGEQKVNVDPSEVQVGDILFVYAGERIAVDGIVVDGHSSLDLSVLNGESLPINVKVGDEVLSGAINIDGILQIQAVKNYGNSTFSRVIELIEEGSAKKSRSEEFITRFSRYYTPSVTFLAILIAFVPPLFLGIMSESFLDSFSIAFKEWFAKGLIFLVVSCPCALVISIPLSFFVSLGKASREGILLKGSSYLESLFYAKSIVFDKTGTLTKGELRVVEITTKEGISREEALSLAQKLEEHSNHPIARAILNESVEVSFQLEENLQEISEQAGGGLKAIYKGEALCIGNPLFVSNEIGNMGEFTQSEQCQILLAYGQEVIASFILEDEIKQEAAQNIQALKALGIQDIYVLSGDKKNVVESVAKTLQIPNFYGELLPADKVFMLQKILDDKDKRKVIFVGDGINDAPSLALSDIGVAMGKKGSDVALEGADMVIMNDHLSKIPLAIQIARKTRSILRQNIIFALGTKAAIMVFGVLGVANMWIALFGDVGVAFLALLNAMRALR